jgi:hypothetical protein
MTDEDRIAFPALCYLLKLECERQHASAKAAESKLAAIETCGCSWDASSDVCEHHSPALVAALDRAEKAEAALAEAEIHHELATGRAVQAERELDEANARARTNAVLMAEKTGKLIKATVRADRIERETIERCFRIVDLAICTVGYGAGREQMIKARDDIGALLEPKP